jgi:hypothetical protein
MYNILIASGLSVAVYAVFAVIIHAVGAVIPAAGVFMGVVFLLTR